MHIWQIYCCDWAVDYSEVKFSGRYFILSACKSCFRVAIFIYRPANPVFGSLFYFIGLQIPFSGRYFYLSVHISRFWTGNFSYRSIFLISGPILPFQTNMKRMRQPTLSHPLQLPIYLLIDLAILDTVWRCPLMALLNAYIFSTGANPPYPASPIC